MVTVCTLMGFGFSCAAHSSKMRLELMILCDLRLQFVTHELQLAAERVCFGALQLEVLTKRVRVLLHSAQLTLNTAELCGHTCQLCFVTPRARAGRFANQTFEDSIG